MRSSWVFSIVLIVVGGVGCAVGEPAGAPSSLRAPFSLSTRDTSAQSRVSFTIAGGYAGPTALSMPMHDAKLSLSSTGTRATIEALSIPLGDLDISASALPPQGLALRALSLQVDNARADITQADDDTLTLHAEAPLTLHWSLQLSDGTLYPLAPTPTNALPIDLTLVRSAASPDSVAVTLRAVCAGSCWSDPGVAELSDGNVLLQADAALVE